MTEKSLEDTACELVYRSPALQEPVLNAWRGQAENVSLAQSILYHRAKMNNAANNGRYSDRIELMAA